MLFRNAILLLTGLVSRQRLGNQDVPVIMDLSEVMASITKYLKLSRGMCFNYDQDLGWDGTGSYLQTKELIKQNSVYEVIVDISESQRRGEVKSGRQHSPVLRPPHRIETHTSPQQSLYSQRKRMTTHTSPQQSLYSQRKRMTGWRYALALHQV